MARRQRMKVPCPVCRARLRSTRFKIRVVECQRCKHVILDDPFARPRALPPIVDRAQLEGVKGIEVDKLVQGLLDDRGWGIDGIFRTVPRTASEARRKLLPITARRSWSLWDPVEPCLSDSVAGFPWLLSPLERWEARYLKYSWEVGWDREDRLRWQASRYGNRFVWYDYRGKMPIERLEYYEGRPCRLARMEDPTRIVEWNRSLGVVPTLWLLRWEGSRLLGAREERWGTELSDTRYHYRRGKLSRIVVSRKVKIEEFGCEPWMRCWKEERASGSATIDVDRLRDTPRTGSAPPRYLRAVSRRSARVVGTFNHASGEVAVPRCPGGDHPMHILLNIPPVSVLWCAHCSWTRDRVLDQDFWYADFSDPRRPRPLSGCRGRKARAEGTDEVLHPMFAEVMHPPVRVDELTRHKLGGSPLWIQHETWPRCPRCRRRMDFWGQVGSDRALGLCFGDWGVVYTFWCKRCKLTASTEQFF